jgi:hypothetical protein
LGIEWNTDYDLHKIILDAKERYLSPFLMEVLITGCWSIWTMETIISSTTRYHNFTNAYSDLDLSLLS